MNKLHSKHEGTVQHISNNHSIRVLGEEIHAVFYDVITLFFEIQREDEIRMEGFSKDGKPKHSQIVLGLSAKMPTRLLTTFI
jgi:hypothetical protein